MLDSLFAKVNNALSKTGTATRSQAVDIRRIETLWSHVHWLCVLGTLGSFTAAAQRLGVSKAAMSQRISDLERAAGVPLVLRTTRSVRLTEAGQQLADATGGAFEAIGTAFAGGGLNTTLRDLARFGELLRNHGRVGSTQVLPEAAVRDTFAGADPARFAPNGPPTLPGWSYRNMWWVSHNPHGAIMARGVHGQNIYIDPKAEMVIARYASHPIAANIGNDPHTLPAYHAMGLALLG
jgi:DNA-binding transcriptional LysR family regulator